MVEDAAEHERMTNAIAANDTAAVEELSRQAITSWRTRPVLYADPVPEA
jgi:DNA-binding GntR family transcriptional regulator